MGIGMPSTKSKWITWLEFIPLQGIFALAQLLPFRFCLAVGRGLGMMLYFLLPPLRKITMKGLAQAFEQTHSLSQRKQIAKRCYKHFGMVIMEFMQLPKLQKRGTIHELVEFGSSLETIDRLLARNEGIIAIAAHFGNWELMTAATASLGYPIHVIVRLLDNPMLDEYVEAIRRQFGTQVIDKFNVLKPGLKALHKRGVLAFLMDQNTAFNMVFVPFFGNLAATARGPVIFSRRRPRTPVMAAWSWRDEQYKLHVVFEEIPVDHSITDPKEFERIHTEQFTSYFEQVIRHHPEQWLWWHERWKSRPEEQDDYPSNIQAYTTFHRSTSQNERDKEMI
jgi:Kdo2-lipid IVA lauroyltransferase/acyltransferase